MKICYIHDSVSHKCIYEENWPLTIKGKKMSLKKGNNKGCQMHVNSFDSRNVYSQQLTPRRIH